MRVYKANDMIQNCHKHVNKVKKDQDTAPNCYVLRAGISLLYKSELDADRNPESVLMKYEGLFINRPICQASPHMVKMIDCPSGSSMAEIIDGWEDHWISPMPGPCHLEPSLYQLRASRILRHQFYL
jgi:hypothetical protein